MWLTHFWHSCSQFFIFAWDVTAGGILRTGVLICLVMIGPVLMACCLCPINPLAAGLLICHHSSVTFNPEQTQWRVLEILYFSIQLPYYNLYNSLWILLNRSGFWLKLKSLFDNKYVWLCILYLYDLAKYIRDQTHCCKWNFCQIWLKKQIFLFKTWKCYMPWATMIQASICWPSWWFPEYSRITRPIPWLMLQGLI